MANKKNKVHIILTGGTIDSYYDGKLDTVKCFDKSIIPKYLDNLNLYFDFKFTTVCMKDSRELTRKDLKKILDTITKSKYKHIIVTHGSYTMPDTTRYLKANLKKNDKTIILTGSMIPLDDFSMSDAQFNLGYCLSAFNYLKHGIHLCMNGKIFSADESMKVISEGRFSSIFGE
ncbi:MAG: asparaginase domain-containing protein [Candidatus Diapherotrites archaeon]